jgi:misacylated tRNA(Ala) deacylase
MMATELLFERDSYRKEFQARVIEVTPEGGVILDSTAFFPGGGGQPCDLGELSSTGQRHAVIRAGRMGADIIHSVEGRPPAVGTWLTGRLDWERRYQLMRTHTAMHVLCGVIWRDYGALVTGGNMEPLLGRMDFEFETMHQDLVHEIEQTVNAEVALARPVLVDVLPREVAFEIPDLIRTKINLLPESIQKVRIVEIKGLDLQADGGTHVANTSEVGRIRVADYKSKGKINKRMYIELERVA